MSFKALLLILKLDKIALISHNLLGNETKGTNIVFQLFNMKKILVVVCAALFAVPFSSCNNADDIISAINDGGLSNEEIVKGLRTALEVGTDTAVRRLSATDGYYKDEIVKILLPPEAAPIFDNLSKIPGGNTLVENTIMAINRAAEDAAPEATSIFVNAITDITISDGLNILNGNDSAATSFLKKGTYSPLQTAFAPKINTSLGKPLVLGASAASLYTDLVDTYNTASLNGLLFPKITQNTLGDYVTSRALDGLFTKVAVEEGKIRNDVAHRVTDILEKVFK